MISLRNISKRFGKTEVLRNISLDISDEEMMVFVGPSGCGKSTLLRLIAGFEKPSGGEIVVGNSVVNEVEPADRGVAMVFQNYALYPHMTVADNIGFCLRNIKVPKQEIKTRVEKVADSLQIQNLLHRLPAELSGGQRQRVAIGRAIIRNPKVYLFDEPLSNLDAILRVHTRVEIAKLHQRQKKTMIYVTHDQVEAMTLATRIAVINKGQIEQVGTPLELYHKPKNIFVAGFLGSPAMGFLSGKLISASEQEAKIELPGGVQISVPRNARHLPLQASVSVGIRPERLKLVHEQSSHGIPAAITVVERLGSRTMFHCLLENGTELISEQEHDNSSIRAGDRVFLDLPAAETHVFDSTGNALSAASPWGQGR